MRKLLVLVVLLASHVCAQTCGKVSVNPFSGQLDCVGNTISGTYANRGAWASGTTYAALDNVGYNGVMYVSLQDSNVGHTPSSSPTFWATPGAPGGQGIQGIQGIKGDQGPNTALVHATIRYVSTTGDDANDGSRWDLAKATVGAAVASLPASGPSHQGKVLIAPGTYTVSSTLELNSYITYECQMPGDGALSQATVIKLANSSNVALFAPTSGFIAAGEGAYAHYAQIKNCTLDGNAANNSTAPAMVQIFHGGFGNMFSSVTFQNSKDYALLLLNKAVGFSCEHCMFSTNGGAVKVNDTQGGNNIIFTDTQIDNSGPDPIRIIKSDSDTGGSNYFVFNGLKAEATVTSGTHAHVIRTNPTTTGGHPSAVVVNGMTVVNAVGGGVAALYEDAGGGAGTNFSINGLNAAGYTYGFQSAKTGQTFPYEIGLAAANDGTTDQFPAIGVNGAGIFRGAGTPEGVTTAPIGSLFLRSDGSSGTGLYVKESGAGNTGWVAKGAGGGGSGTVTGPGTSTNKAVSRFSGTSGATIQDSTVLIDDSGFVTAAGYSAAGQTNSALSALPSGAQGVACDESATTGIPATGVDYLRCDSVTHKMVFSFNGSTELPITSGGTSVSVNSSLVSPPNFRSDTPAPDAGFTALTFKVSGSNIIVEMPFTVASGQNSCSYWMTPPVNPTDTGATGDCAADATYLYAYTGGRWQRSAWDDSWGTSTVAKPVFDTAGIGQTYNNDTVVTITDATGAAIVCATNNGVTPTAATAGTCDNATTSGSSPQTVTVSATNTTIKAIGTKVALTNSLLKSDTYTLQVATPTASPVGGSSVGSGSTITWASVTTGFTAHYTFGDGTQAAPVCSGGSTGNATISSAGTYKVIGCKSGYADSALASFAYTISASPISKIGSTQTAEAFGGGTATTPTGYTTTGATLLVGTIGGGNTCPSSTVTDSKSNTWHFLGSVVGSLSGGGDTCIVYSYSSPGGALITGTNHTLSVSGNNAPTITFTAFTNTLTNASDPYDSSAGVKTGVTSGSATTWQVAPGTPLTPSQANALVLSTAHCNGVVTLSISSPFAVGGQIGSLLTQGMGYVIQTTATGAQPTWTNTSAIGCGSVMAAFLHN